MRLRLAVTALAVVLSCVPAAADHEGFRIFDYIATRLNTVLQDLSAGRTTAARAALEIQDLQAIAAAAQVAFSTEITAAGGGNTPAQAIAGLQALLSSAAQALATSSTGPLQTSFQIRTAAAGPVASALASTLHGGFSGLTSQQRTAIEGAVPGSSNAVRAADGRTPISPGSIASSYPNGDVTNREALGALDARGQLPSILSGVMVLVDGRIAPLFFASPRQVNFAVPESITANVVDVIVTGDNGAIKTGTVTAAAVAPSIFTRNQTGSGPGAILNAVTNDLGQVGGPFTVTTPQNPGDDKRTRLAIYLTGVRNAPNTNAGNDLRLPTGEVLVNVAESVTVTIGGSQATVEFAGRHTVWIGLDQINVIVPAELAGRGTVDLIVRAGTVSSNTVQITIQ